MCKQIYLSNTYTINYENDIKTETYITTSFSRNMGYFKCPKGES